jgi:hypothetical protein
MKKLEDGRERSRKNSGSNIIKRKTGEDKDREMKARDLRRTMEVRRRDRGG